MEEKILLIDESNTQKEYTLLSTLKGKKNTYISYLEGKPQNGKNTILFAKIVKDGEKKYLENIEESEAKEVGTLFKEEMKKYAWY